MRKKMKKVLAVLLVLTIFTDIISTSTFAKNNSGTSELQQDVTIITDNVLGENQTGEEVNQEYLEDNETQRIYENENAKVLFTLTGMWETGFQANIEIQNTGDSMIENWYLTYDFNNSISNIWDAEIYKESSGEYVIIQEM